MEARLSRLRPVATAVVGVGYFGARHVDVFARLPGCKLVALVDPAPATGELAARLGVAWYRRVEALPSSVEAASLVTPVQTHHHIAKLLLERGIDVLLEKPIAETEAQAIELCSLAERLGRVLQIGHLERYNPAFTAGCELLARARRIRAVRSTQRSPPTHATDVVTDLMIHDLDLVLHEISSEVVAVNAEGGSLGGCEIDEADAQLSFANGCEVRLSARWGSRKPGPAIRQMVAELEGEETWVLDFGLQTTYRRPNAPPRPPRMLDVLERQLDCFLDACRSRNAPRVTPEDGHAALALARAIRSRILA